MQVPLYRLTVREEAISAVAEVMRSGWIGMGPKAAAFEKAFARYVGVDHAIAVNTCTSALHMATRLLSLEPGAQVITTPLTFVATNQALKWERLEVVFADIDPVSGNLDPMAVQRCITERSAAIVLVHFGGYPCDLDGINAVAQRHGLRIIEDCAHACGASYRGRPIGSGENLCAFSFGPPKNLTTGDGGMLIVRSAEDARRARELRYMGISRDTHARVAAAGAGGRHWDYDVDRCGMRYHMNDIAAAMGLVHLPYLDEDNRQRAIIAARYREGLAGIAGLQCIDHAADRASSHHLFCVLADDRDRLADALLSRRVTVSVHYQRNDCYRIFKRQHLPGAEQFCRRVLSLPMFPQLTIEQQEHVIQSIRKGW